MDSFMESIHVKSLWPRVITLIDVEMESLIDFNQQEDYREQNPIRTELQIP